uniref:Uncharacterized protein n=1 Tax=Arundo donax TaxID=35708 RepID=A0A0A9B529_ARUDO
MFTYKYTCTHVFKYVQGNRGTELSYCLR